MRKMSVTKQALKLYSANNPKYFPCVFLQTCFQNFSPYFNLWMSAEIVTAMQEKRSAREIWLLVVVTLLGNFLVHVMSALLKRVVSIQLEILQNNEAAAFNRKTLSLDYDKMENPEIRKHRRKIIENAYIDSYGVVNMRNLLCQIMDHAINLAFAAVLFVEMLTLIVSAPFHWGALALFAGLAAGIVLHIRLQARATAKSAKIWKEVGELMLEENRLGNGYSTDGMDSRIYRQQNWISAFYEKVNRRHLEMFSKAQNEHFLFQLPPALSDIATDMIIHLIICLYCALGVFPVGAVIKYVGYMSRITSSIGNLFYVINCLEDNEPFLQVYLDYFAIKNDMYQGSLAVEKRSDKKFDIEFRHVSFRYAGAETPTEDAERQADVSEIPGEGAVRQADSVEKNALTDINLKIKVGERLAVVGMNGSGKTTFIKLLCRLYDPTEGEIFMNDFNIRKYDYREYLSLFSVVFQDYTLLSLPLGNNVASAAEWDAAKAERLIEEVGFGGRYREMPKKLETPLYKDFDEDGVNLSGGEAQKLALARALYKDAPFIILDEPTAALDPIAEAEIYARFDEIVGDKTAIYISHRLSSCRFCDKIAVFDKGRIVQLGTHEGLLEDTKGKYYELWNAQAQYYTKEGMSLSAV